MNHKGLGSFFGAFWPPERARGSKNHQFRLCFNKGFAKNAAVPNFMPKKHPFRLVLIRVSWRQQNSKNACEIPSISLGFYKGFVTKQHDMWIHVENFPFRFVIISVPRRRKCTKNSCKIARRSDAYTRLNRAAFDETILPNRTSWIVDKTVHRTKCAHRLSMP